MNMRVVDLFCGAGGFSYGMQSAGHHVVAAFDYEGRPLAVHAANVPAIKFRWGLSHLRYAAVREASWKGGHRRADLTDVLAMAPDIAELNPDVIVGGPPCQPFSKSGKRRGDEDPRARLTEAYGIIVATARPRYFVMENVPEIRTSKVFRRMKHIVRRAGYGLTEMVVNASEYGSAQNRDRFLAIGALDEPDGWFNDYMAEARSVQPTTVADILPEFGVELHRKGTKWIAIGCRRTAPAKTINKGQTKSSGGYRLRPADMRLLEKSGDSFKAYWRYPGGRSSGGIRRMDEPSPTIIKSSGGGPGKKYRPRKGDVIDLRLLPVPSLDDLSRIAGFPTGWNWTVRSKEKTKPKGSKSLSPIQMLANAVPPPLAASIGRGLSAHAMKRIPVVVRPEWQVPEPYVEWLGRTQNLADDMMAQELAALREAKSHVCGHDLPNTAAEVAAFDKVAAIAHGALGEEPRLMLRRALTRFSGWESYTRSLPSDRELKNVIKVRPYLRGCHPALRMELAALEFDLEFHELPDDRREEWRQRVIALFEAGDPWPYSSSSIEPDPHHYPEDEETSPPPFSLRLRAEARKRSENASKAVL
jgi:site-specific DNA-cytosine methylase